MNKQAIWASGVAVGGGGAIAVIAALGMAAPSPAVVSGADVLGGKAPAIAALASSKERAVDIIPPALLELPLADRFAPDARATKVGTFGSDDYYLIQGVDRTVCLISVTPAPAGELPMSGGTCAPVATVATSGIYSLADDGSGKFTVAVVAPDGISTVGAGHAEAKVSNNVAIFTTDDPSEIRLTNSTLRKSTAIDTGSLKPDKFVPADE